MKSDVIKISRDQDNLNKILYETQKIAEYASLNAKQTIKTRLIAEEFVGMLKELSQDFEGDFWIEKEGLSFSFIAQLYINEIMDKQTKRKFIEISYCFAGRV